MTSSELFNKFIEFEQEHDVFKLKTDSSIYWWDIVRYSIYNELNNNFIRQFAENSSVHNRKNSMLILNKMIKDTFNLFKSLFFKKKFFFFLCSRSKDNSNYNFDSVARNFIKSVPSNNSFYLETYFNAKTEYSSYSNIFLKIIAKLYVSKEIKLNFDINKILNKEFKTEIDFYSVVQKNLNAYNLEYKYYKALFRMLRPKYCFVVQNGIQKALFSVTNELDIKCIELQHGQINRFHIAYSYSNKIDYSHLNTFPSILFTCSDFWNKINFPVKEKISMGIEYQETKNTSIISGDIVFVFANIYTDNLLDFVKKLAPKFENKIYVKLHPNQKNEIEYIKEELASFSNIEIIYIEKTMNEILSVVSSVVMIQSTTVYEALQKEKKVFIYKVQDYDTHIDIFDNPNVFLIDSVEEFLQNKDVPFDNTNKIIYFDEFNKAKLLAYLEENS